MPCVCHLLGAGVAPTPVLVRVFPGSSLCLLAAGERWPRGQQLLLAFRWFCVCTDNERLVPRLCDWQPLYSAAANMGDWEGLGGGGTKRGSRKSQEFSPQARGCPITDRHANELGTLQGGLLRVPWSLEGLLPGDSHPGCPFWSVDWGWVQGKNTRLETTEMPSPGLGEVRSDIVVHPNTVQLK